MRHMDVGIDMWIMPQMVDWDVTDLGLVLLMWTVMMAAMMLPSVLPVILVLVRFGGSAHAAGFIAGYLVAWGGFSVAATLVHWALLEGGPSHADDGERERAIERRRVGRRWGLPVHAIEARLSRPLSFAMGAVLNPSSATIATREGLRQGAFCVGCCWVLMSLLFVAGVMNLLWIAVIAAYVITEKWAPGAEWFGRAVGALLFVAAGVVFGVGAS